VGASTSHKPRPPRPVTGIALLFTLYHLLVPEILITNRRLCARRTVQAEVWNEVDVGKTVKDRTDEEGPMWPMFVECKITDYGARQWSGV
jgi:hypothetical protein